MEEKKVLKDHEDLTVTIKGLELNLKVTNGFWKHCGFKREDAGIIETDRDKYEQALKLAVYYGNKSTYNWSCIADLEKQVTEDDFDDIETDYANKLSFAMVYFMPKNLRDIMLKKLDSMGEAMEGAVDAALDEDTTQDSEKKN